MVGGRRSDLAGADQAGLACAGVPSGKVSRGELAGAGGDFLCDAPADAAGVVPEQGA
ncbi:MAG: hypothetical protein K6E40_13120 [Desulfovibrio sp.]|nr:hypothetical protein [Desulfovibrio sp.]